MQALLSLAFIAGLVRFVLISAGIGIVSYIGFDNLLTWASAEIKNNLGSLPAAVMQLAGLAHLDYAVNVVLSAYTVRLTVMTLRRFKVL